MMERHFQFIQSHIQKNAPLIHCLTNPITMNDCANAILSIGGRPIMAEHPDEIDDITPHAQALLLNLGCPSDLRLASMKRAAQIAHRQGIPVVMDLVGVHASHLRMDFAQSLASECPSAIFKGNRSEIIAFFRGALAGSGVDVSPHDQIKSEHEIAAVALDLARRHSAVIMVTGKEDIIADAQHAIVLKNGTPRLAQVTGSGCVLGAIAACLASTKQHFEAAMFSVSLINIAGERADHAQGLASFRMAWLDHIGSLSAQTLCKHINNHEVNA